MSSEGEVSRSDANRAKASADWATTIFRIAVPVLLGAILTYLAQINIAQTHQGEQLATLSGQFGVISQQNSDYLERLSKVEVSQAASDKNIADLTGRVLVLESARSYK